MGFQEQARDNLFPQVSPRSVLLHSNPCDGRHLTVEIDQLIKILIDEIFSAT